MLRIVFIFYAHNVKMQLFVVVFNAPFGQFPWYRVGMLKI